jgi:hypothetical protein
MNAIPDDKALATTQAQFALLGWSLNVIPSDAGEPHYRVSRHRGAYALKTWSGVLGVLASLQSAAA